MALSVVALSFADSLHGSLRPAVLASMAVDVVANPLARSRACVDADDSARASQEDAALVEAVCAGDRSAEAVLYRRHAGPILNLATRLLRSHEEALDVLQDAFVIAFESLADLREPAAFRPWLQRVVVHLVHRRFRRRKLLGMLGLWRTSTPTSLDAARIPQFPRMHAPSCAGSTASLRPCPSRARRLDAPQRRRLLARRGGRSV